MSELKGQMDLDELMGMRGTTATEAADGAGDGYDAEGHLMDYAPPVSAREDFGDCVGEARTSALTTPNSDAEARLNVIASEVNAITEQTRGVVISAALAIGKRLIEAKNLVPRGRFGEWLELNVHYSERKAQDMMRLYDQYGRGTIPEAVSALDYSKAIALLSAPEEQRAALAEKAAQEELSVRQLNAEIARLRAETEGKQTRIDELLEQVTDRDAAMERAKLAEARAEAAEESSKASTAELLESERTARAAIEREREAARLSEAKAKSAEASAEELRKLRADAEERAEASAQRAADAVNRANETAKKLAEAKARIAEMEAKEPEARVVEVVPDAVERELKALRKELEEARRGTTSSVTADAAPPSGPNAVERFKWFYANQMKNSFETALRLLRDVAQEDAKAADMFATALVNGCKRLMEQLGES